MVEKPVAVVIVLPSVVKVENSVSVEIGVCEPPEPPAPATPVPVVVPDSEPEAELEPEPVAVAEPEPPVAVALGVIPATPVSEPMGPVAVPGAVRAETAGNVLAAEPVAAEATNTSQTPCTVPSVDNLREAQ